MAETTMDAIKKKMQAMKLEKETAFDRADQLEQRLVEHKYIYDKQAEEIHVLNQRIIVLNSDVESARGHLQATTDKLEQTNHQLAETEAEVQTLTKQVRALEEEYEQTESRLHAANEKLELATKAADESERSRKVLENRSVTDEERIFQLQKELEAAVLLGEETDRKFEETAHQLAMTEVDLERGDARLEAAENKILDLEEELRVVCNNMKSLEIFEQEAVQRGVVYEEHIQTLTKSLNNAETRLTDSERLMIKLQQEVDRLEDALAVERDKYKVIATDLDSTFTEISGY